MAKGQPRDLVRERQWRERIRHWQASRLTIREFCRRHGLAETAFHFWRRELRDREAARATPPTFVPVTIVPSPISVAKPTAADGMIEVRCPSGHIVCVPVGALAILFTALAVVPSGEDRSC